MTVLNADARVVLQLYLLVVSMKAGSVEGRVVVPIILWEMGDFSRHEGFL